MLIRPAVFHKTYFAMTPFIIGGLYFGYKAFYLKEKWVSYAIIGGLITGTIFWLLYFLFGSFLYALGLEENGTILTILTCMPISISLVDKWSGLHWDKVKHGAVKNKREEDENSLSSDEMAEIMRLQIQKNKGSLNELETDDSNPSPHEDNPAN